MTRLMMYGSWKNKERLFKEYWIIFTLYFIDYEPV
jgi:hypothetical protein